MGIHPMFSHCRTLTWPIYCNTFSSYFHFLDTQCHNLQCCQFLYFTKGLLHCGPISQHHGTNGRVHMGWETSATTLANRAMALNHFLKSSFLKQGLSPFSFHLILLSSTPHLLLSHHTFISTCFWPLEAFQAWGKAWIWLPRPPLCLFFKNLNSFLLFFFLFLIILTHI